MELWRPPTDQPHLLEWWRPLLLASRTARHGRCAWPIHVDDFTLSGRVDRSSRPSVWVYKHGESRGELYLDATGQAYRFSRTRDSRSIGRFTACDIRVAIWQAGLPGVVPPVWYDEPPQSDWDDGSDDAGCDGDELAGGPDPVSTHPAAPGGRRTRGHLTLLAGGRPLAG